MRASPAFTATPWRRNAALCRTISRPAPLQRLGDSGGAVGQVIPATGLTDTGEAALRAGFSATFSRLHRAAFTVFTDDSRVRPGVPLNFTHRSIEGTRFWQACDVFHPGAGGSYRNLTPLMMGDEPWRPPTPPETGPVVPAAGVDDGKTAEGGPAARDRWAAYP